MTFETYKLFLTFCNDLSMITYLCNWVFWQYDMKKNMRNSDIEMTGLHFILVSQFISTSCSMLHTRYKEFSLSEGIPTAPTILNPLAPGKFKWNFRYVISKWISVSDVWGISCEIALIRMSLDFTDDQSTLDQVMAWCRQAISHYLSQCWPRPQSPRVASLALG